MRDSFINRADLGDYGDATMPYGISGYLLAMQYSAIGTRER